MTRRGFFFLFFMTMMVFIILIIFFTTEAHKLQQSQEAVRVRAHTINDFLQDFYADAERGSFIAGYRSLVALEEEVTRTGAFLDDADHVFREAFYNGTINGRNVTIMENSSFREYIDRVAYNAESTGIRFDLNVSRIRLYQIDPWHIHVDVVAEINLSDDTGRFGWNLTRNISTSVPIFDIIDPLYSNKTLSKIPNTIRKTNITEFVNDVGNANDTTDLKRFWNRSEYRASDQAPSILMRFEGNLSASPFGIESMVNTLDLARQGIAVDPSRSVVDYIYWGEGVTSDRCSVQNMPSEFRIDEGHEEVYEVDEVLSSPCPP